MRLSTTVVPSETTTGVLKPNIGINNPLEESAHVIASSNFRAPHVRLGIEGTVVIQNINECDLVVRMILSEPLKDNTNSLTCGNRTPLDRPIVQDIVAEEALALANIIPFVT